MKSKAKPVAKAKRLEVYRGINRWPRLPDDDIEVSYVVRRKPTRRKT